MTDQTERGDTFRALHIPGDPFVLANVWDIGSARMMVAMGAKALATTSAGFAFTVGEPDGAIVSRDQMMDHCEDIAGATTLPVQGDLENGYADDPDGVAECIEVAAEVGLVAACIEDTTFEEGKPYYDFEIAVERIRAAVEAAENLPFAFTLTARADGVLTGAYDVDEAIRRCIAFEQVGAHCLYVPLLPSLDDLKRLCDSVEVPVNVLAAGRFANHSIDEFAEVGAARISVGSALSRVTHKVVQDVGNAMLNGDFTGFKQGARSDEIDAMLTGNRAD